jgi:deazaflavin-dependent oxidoreductase (nitroreductase family)
MPEITLADALKKRKQISITVTGRRTGRQIAIPVWFVHDESAVWLLPVYGSNTQWFKNLQKNRMITIQAGSEKHEGKARLLKSHDSIRNVVNRFREKYTPAEIKRWYKGLDVAVNVPIQ